MKIEGKNAVREAILSGANIDKLLASNQINEKVFNEIVALAKSRSVKVQFVSNQILNSQASTPNHQGLVAHVSDFKYSEVEDILNYANELGQPPFVLILDGINDPHNFGSIIRVADGMGVHGIIIGKDRAVPVNETVVKVSTGATSYVKIAKVTNINREIEFLKEKGVWVYACELGGEQLFSQNLLGPIGIVVGSEGKGVSHLTKKLCDGIVTIPMKGKVNSLNASVATGVVLYEVLRQRELKK